MLTKLSIENFQSLMFPQSIRFAPLTLIVGANSSGKSSISRALRLFQQSFERNELHFAGERVDLTSFKTAISLHDTSGEIRFGLEIQSSSKWASASYELLFKRRNLSFTLSGSKSVRINGFSGGGEFRLRPLGDGDSSFIGGGSFSFEAAPPRANSKYLELSFSVSSGAEHLRTFIEDFSADREYLYQITDDLAPLNPGGLLMLDGDPARDLENWKSIPVMMHGLIPQVAIHPEVASLPTTTGMVITYQLMKLVNQTFTVVGDTVSGLLSVAPLRSIISGLSPKPVGKKFISSTGDNIQQVLLAMSEAEFRKVSDLLEKLTRKKYHMARLTMRTDEANVGEFFQVVLIDLSNDEPVPVLFQDAGVGISQVLPILVAISRSPLAGKRSFSGGRPGPARRITFIEQPELHLHPEMQADLADVLLDIVKPVKNREGRLIRHSQIVVETHSESMILRIQKRIREGKIDRDDVAIIGVDSFAGGGSLAQEYRISSEGQLVDELPRDFSTLRLNELL